MRHWNSDGESKSHGGRLPNPLQSLKILIRKDNAAVITACGLMYAVYYAITASLSTLCVEIYDLNQWQAGLIYLPFGLGGTLSTFFSGRLLDRAYKHARIKRGLSTDKAKGDDLDRFPIEKARLRVMWIPLQLTAMSTLAYGWVLHFRKVSRRSTTVGCSGADTL